MQQKEKKRGRPRKTDAAEGTEVVPVKKKPRGIAACEKMGGEYIEPGDNAQYLRFAMACWDLPPLDISSAKQIEQRSLEFLEHCIKNDMKPNVQDWANWLGIGRMTIWRWTQSDPHGPEHKKVITKMYGIMESQAINYAINGKTNPASIIFILKNHFGYRDVIDIAPTKAPPLGEMEDRKALEARILDAAIDDGDE